MDTILSTKLQTLSETSVSFLVFLTLACFTRLLRHHLLLKCFPKPLSLSFPSSSPFTSHAVLFLHGTYYTMLQLYGLRVKSWKAEASSS